MSAERYERLSLAEMLAELQVIVRDDQQTNRERIPSEEPGERVIAAADLDWLADREAERDERWRESA